MPNRSVRVRARAPTRMIASVVSRRLPAPRVPMLAELVATLESVLAHLCEGRVSER